MEVPSFKCKDIGMKCAFEANAPNEWELEKKIAEHTRSAHDMKQVKPEMWEKIKKVIK